MTHATPTAPRRVHNWSRKPGLIADSYAWLADRDDPSVTAYLNAENTHSDNWFAGRTDTIDAIYAEIESRIKQDDSTVPVLHNSWWYASSTRTGQSYAIHTRGHTPESVTDQVLLDENLAATGHSYFSASALEVSHDNRLLAWSADTTGDEKYLLRIRDLDTGCDLDDAIEDVSWGGVVWSRDDRWIFYVVTDEAMRPWQVRRHLMGDDVNNDTVVFEEPDERFFVNISETRSGKWILIESSSKTSSQSWLIDADDPTGAPHNFHDRRENVEYHLDHWGDRFTIVTNLEGSDFSVMVANETDTEQWQPLIPHVAGSRIVGFDCFDSWAVMSRWVEGQQRLSVVHRDGSINDIDVVDEPHEVELDANPDYVTSEVRLSYQSLTIPHTVARFEVDTGAVSTLKRTEVPGVDLSKYVAERTWARSHDGTRVPLDIVRHVDTPLDASAPGLIYVYGAYEISLAPWFSVARLSLLDRGWVWALAHPRGGGEMGRDWYEDGKLLRKRNTFLDTIACADHLADTGVCDGARLVVRGGSAGGLTVGACITMAPQRFAAAVAEVPFVDVTNTMCDPDLPLTVTEWEEWGDPREEPHFGYISGYSPYDNVTAVTYPDLFVTAGLHDPRVSYHEPAKWVARIRHDSPDTFVLLSCEMEAGHGGPSGRYAQWRDEARTLAFVIDRVSSTPPR